jgi:hypothetical protein
MFANYLGVHVFNIFAAGKFRIKTDQTQMPGQAFDFPVSL